MYCSHCGSATGDDLNYCKNCGARNEKNALNVDHRMAGLAMSAAGAIGIIGLVGFFFVMRELLRSPASTPGSTFFILVAYLAALLVMFTIFIRMAKSTGTGHTLTRGPKESATSPAYLRPITTAQLREPHDMPASVTEHTTRALDEIPLRER
ncbi:MAG TPA: hypothetical protein VGO43_06365 [Pyrinomonadaceae bacterium]|jgi:hypothetical protein|nr:hypothetical protein [Pyrinomonadaceae bacterium]